MLDALQERIARIALALPGADGLALASGGAMLADRVVDRQTQDVDMFTPDDDVMALADALGAALGAEGMHVAVETYVRRTSASR